MENSEDQSRDFPAARPAGWYDDPSGKQVHQAYWNGERWTGDTRTIPGYPSIAEPPAPDQKLTEAQIWFSYKGRIGVGQYWGRFALGIAGVFVVAFIIYSSSTDLDSADGVVAFLWLFSIWPSTALAWKRLQDQDKHGAQMFITLIPLIGAVFWLVVSLSNGTPGPNKYGPATGYTTK